jgi:hypothetical protein
VFREIFRLGERNVALAATCAGARRLKGVRRVAEGVRHAAAHSGCGSGDHPWRLLRRLRVALNGSAWPNVLLLLVDSKVAQHIAALRKGPLALGAAIRPLARVDAQVALQVVFLQELALARRAHKALFGRVDARVASQVSLARKLLLARGATIDLSASTDAHKVRLA